MKRLWYREIKYLAQDSTVKEPSLEPSLGDLNPEPMQLTTPYTVMGQGDLSRGKNKQRSE